MVCFNKEVTTFAQYVEHMAHDYRSLSSVSVMTPLAKPVSLSESPKVLILAPHPDDECLMAGAALRMKEDWNAQVVVIPFSYGSKVERRKARSQELQAAISVLGFDVIQRLSLEKITDTEFLTLLKQLNPEVIISPHSQDLHPTHLEAHALVERCRTHELWFQSEYWHQMEYPNCFIPLDETHVIRIGEALLKHTGEISRNPYHLRLPAWYMDQARRAQELVPNHPQAHYLFGMILKLL
jgi:LmbE family N-acetylglucosaminyl deacetylase